MFHKIVVGCDGSPQSLDAVALGADLAEPIGAQLLLAHVYEQQPMWYGAQRSVARARRDKILSIFDEAQEALPDSVSAETLAVGSDTPARGLHDLAVTEKADLLMLGSTHRGPAGRVLPGSVGEVVMTGAPCAVAIAPRGYRERERGPIRSIGAGFDGSPEAELMLGGADRLARALGASLRTIAVAEARHLPHSHRQRGHPLRERLAEALEGLGRSADEDGIVLEGDPVDALAEAADEVDVLLTGSRGYGPLRHVLPGSVSAPLMRRCPCPLIVLPRAYTSR